jgi:spermidine/putrescine transport system permease protein
VIGNLIPFSDRPKRRHFQPGKAVPGHIYQDADCMANSTRSTFTTTRNRFGVVLGAPTLAWQVCFFVLPLAFLVVMTFWSVRNFRLHPDFTFANWSAVLKAGFFQRAYLYTFMMSAATALVMAVIAFPAAYTLAYRLSSGTRRLLILVLIVPFFTSFPVRIYSMQIFFSPAGIVNTFIGWFGFHPLSVLNSPVGTFIGFLTLTAPLVVLLQTFALTAVDPHLVEAAHNLRCGRFRTITSIIIPSARVGLIVSAALAFVLAFGDYISPQFLGGSNPPTLSILIADQVKSGNNWPRASVVAVVMIITLMVVLGAMLKLAYSRRKMS